MENGENSVKITIFEEYSGENNNGGQPLWLWRLTSMAMGVGRPASGVDLVGSTLNRFSALRNKKLEGHLGKLKNIT